jgi:hypothetical protein
MLRAFDAEVAHLLLDDARVAVVGAGREACRDDVGQEVPVEARMLGGGGTLEVRERRADQAQSGEETQARGREVGGSSGVGDHGANDVVGEEQRVDFLDDADRFLAAERGGGALVGLDLVGGELELPARVVGQDQLLGGRDAGVEQRGDKPVLDAVARARRIVERVADEPDKYDLAAPTAAIVAGTEAHELATIGERLHRHGRIGGGKPPEEMRACPPRRRDGGAAMEAAIPEDEHPARHRAEQATAGGPLVGIPAPEARVADGVRAALTEGDDLDAWPRAGAARTALATERADVQKEAAERVVRRLAGVRGVSNILMVTPRLDATGIKEKIEGALVRSVETDAGRIKVTVEGSKIILTGRVRSYAEKRTAERSAWSAPGVTAVDNQLVITF